jgi:hypothetical protein
MCRVLRPSAICWIEAGDGRPGPRAERAEVQDFDTEHAEFAEIAFEWQSLCELGELRIEIFLGFTGNA